MAKTKNGDIEISEQIIIDRVHHIRGQKVMLDKDLAEIYGVQTFRLNESVKRNPIEFHYPKKK